jgi:uncharacterized membrane protein
MRKTIVICALAISLALSGCAGGLSGLLGGPPAEVQRAAQIARGPIDFALRAFDGALYAFDLAMDLRRPAAGSPEARRIAAFGRRVLAALAVADAAQRAGSSSTYEEAFRNALTAFNEFKVALGIPEDVALDLRALERDGALADFSPRDREAILAQAEGLGGGSPAASR